MCTWKEANQRNKERYKNRGLVVHVSAILVPVAEAGMNIPGQFTKKIIGGTYKSPVRDRGRSLCLKWMKKAEKRYRRYNRLSAAIESGVIQERPGKSIKRMAERFKWADGLTSNFASVATGHA